MADLKFGEVTEKIIGTAFRVRNTPGCGLREVSYVCAVELELNAAQINRGPGFEMPVYSPDQNAGTRRVDFFAENKISVELKALTQPEDVYPAQAVKYPEGCNLEIGLGINFGRKRLEFHRFTNKKCDPAIVPRPSPPPKTPCILNILVQP